MGLVENIVVQHMETVAECLFFLLSHNLLPSLQDSYTASYTTASFLDEFFLASAVR